MDLTERLKIAISKSGLSQTAIAEKVGTSAQYINHVLKGRNTPSLSLLEKLATVLDLNLNWLIRGEGEMYIGKEPVTNAAPSAAGNPEVESLKNELLNLYRFIAEKGLQLPPGIGTARPA